MPKLRVIIKPPPEPQGDAEQQVEALRDYLLQMSEELAYVLTHLEADNINDSTFERIQGMIPRPYTGLPVMDGDASSGQSEQWARGDHRHGHDSTKADVTALEETADDLAAHIDDKDNPHEVTKAQVGLGNVADERQYSAQNPPPIPTPVQVGAIPATEKGSAGGVAELDSNGMVPSAQLPSYVDDVLEYASLSDFPVSGESGKIYVALDTSRTYRWSGSAYVEISESLALGETSSTAYRGDRGKIAYDHSQVTSGNPHNVTAAEVGARPDTWTPSAADVGAQPSITANGILKGDGLGGVSAASAGTDYQAPLTAGTDYQTPLVAGTDYATPGMIPSVPDPSDAAPQDLGTADAGISGDYSRADHVHNMPDAEDVPYDNTQSGLMATDVQSAIDELAQGGGGGGTAASAVSYDNTGSGLTATNVQDAIDEVYGDIPAQASDIGAQDEITANGILKGDGAGGVSAAAAGTDYQAPLTFDATPTASSTNPVQSGGVYNALGLKVDKAAKSLSSANDLNDVVVPGWYKCTTTPANAPSGNFQNAWFEVVANDSNILQFAYSNPASSTGPTPKVRIRLNGVWGDWVSFDENYPYANQSQLAYIENGTTASRPYSAGEYFCWNGLLYRAKTAISQGAAFTINTNCEQVPEGGLNALKAQTLVRRQTLATSITAGLNEWDVAADAVSGYKPIGIVGVQFAALPRSAVTLSQFLLNNGTNVVVAAQSTQARTSGIAVFAFVLYAKE